MLQVKLDTGFNIQVEFAISPFHKRLLAWIIDLVICWIYIKVISLVFDIQSFFIWAFGGELKAIFISLPVLFYHLLCEVTMNGKSLGKMAMNIKVITSEGGQPSIGQYLIRWAFRLIDFPLLILAAVLTTELPWWTFPLVFSGLACVIFTPKSQRIGDLVADTIIIDLKNTTSWQDTVFT